MNSPGYRKFTYSVLMITLAVMFSGCSEYWWTRGQPPAIAQLLDSAQKDLGLARGLGEKSHQSLALASEQLENSLFSVLERIQSQSNPSQVGQELYAAALGFIALEGEVSYGSRPALAGLSGQIREFMESSRLGTPPNYHAFGLFTARTLRFLAAELRLPATS